VFKLGDVLRETPALLERRDRCATGKTVYYSKADARAALRRMDPTERTRRNTFRCGFCACWHLGHRRGAIT
jgi:hypothetical protein